MEKRKELDLPKILFLAPTGSLKISGRNQRSGTAIFALILTFFNATATAPFIEFAQANMFLKTFISTCTNKIQNCGLAARKCVPTPREKYKLTA